MCDDGKTAGAEQSGVGCELQAFPVHDFEATTYSVPSEESLLVEARVRPDDIAFVSLNQEAKVAITAYDRAVYGTLDGRVVNISPDAITDEQTGETFYIVKVRTSANALRDPRGPGRGVPRPVEGSVHRRSPQRDAAVRDQPRPGSLLL